MYIYIIFVNVQMENVLLKVLIIVLFVERVSNFGAIPKTFALKDLGAPVVHPLGGRTIYLESLKRLYLFALVNLRFPLKAHRREVEAQIE